MQHPTRHGSNGRVTFAANPTISEPRWIRSLEHFATLQRIRLQGEQAKPEAAKTFNSTIDAVGQGFRKEHFDRLAKHRKTFLKETSKAISACAKDTRWSQALAFLETVHRNAIPYDEFSQNGVMAGMSRAISVNERSFLEGKSKAEILWMRTINILQTMQSTLNKPDLCSLSTVLSSLEKVSRWEISLEELKCQRSTEFSELEKNSLKKLKSLPWQTHLLDSSHVVNSALSASSKAKEWLQTLSFFETISTAAFRPDIVSLHILVSSVSDCEVSQGWKRALSSLSFFAASNLQLDGNTWQMTAISCKHESNWQWPLQALERLSSVNLSNLDVALRTACIESCRQWTRALCLVEEMHLGRISIDVTCCAALVAACAASGLRSGSTAARTLLEELSRRSKSSSTVRNAVRLVWALARFQVRKPQILQNAFETSLFKGLENLKNGKSEILASDIATLWWSKASLGVALPKDKRHLLQSITYEILPNCEVHELMQIAWGAARRLESDSSDSWILQSIQDEASRRIQGVEDVGSKHPKTGLVQNIRHILGILWASKQGHALDYRFYRKVQAFLLEYGKSVDRAKPTQPQAESQRAAQNDWKKTTDWDLEDLEDFEDIEQIESKVSLEKFSEAVEPRVLYDSMNKIVLSKPSGWEVHDSRSYRVSSSTGKPFEQLERLELRSFLAEFYVTRSSKVFPILMDKSCSHGFLHRLDVPSSGLILAAKTYEAFYNLQVQLAGGHVLRDYTTLCHGWLLNRSSIDAPVSWVSQQDEAETAPSSYLTLSGQGKYSETGPLMTKLLLQLCPLSSASLILVRIRTGRRHQIRSHFSHVGHPLFCDGKYTAQPTFLRDLLWCPRNFLHRHHLAFKDMETESQVKTGQYRSKGQLDLQRHVHESLPADLMSCLKSSTQVLQVIPSDGSVTES